MNKEKLFDRWINGWGQAYQFTGVLEEDKVNFFKDLEAWYVSRHVEELAYIKKEIVLSLAEMEEALNYDGELGQKPGHDVQVSIKKDNLCKELGQSNI